MGYHGRIGLFELLIASDNVKQMIISRKSIAAIRKTATAEGMRTLLQCGVMKVIEGETDMLEVLSVCIR
jgi:type II secretory ATPase GspE/PulE/Tfp pilus assembly ATPase PilB-like protein